MKPKIDKKLCKFCDFGDKDKDGECLSKTMGRYCRF
jgi:hypothetical protein